MTPKEASASSAATGSEKSKIVRKTIDLKKEIIAKHEEGYGERRESEDQERKRVKK